MTLTVSLGIQYVTVPDVSNYVQADGEQQAQGSGVSVLITQAVEPSVAAVHHPHRTCCGQSGWLQAPRWWSYVSRPQVNTTARCLP